ncbi:hypothetical protein HS041_05510 [Planomonospora sp. ID67723]|uniref:hypothetical protein n=1 Tax=Planomonospora sp. ID67723 TaxID=2738134 RepID=UPI0018C38545|nr:hypothetical protein [Planomonospora sp. ID67723]MBG0827216.1 hypothetical protein [Planomonospora sp. ID67723]
MPGGPPAVSTVDAVRSRPRRSAWFQWIAAFAIAAAPTLYWTFIGPDSYSYGYLIAGDPARCAGNEFMDDHGYGILGVVYEVPFLGFGGSPLWTSAAWSCGAGPPSSSSASSRA